MVRALSSEHAKVRINAIEALEEMAYRSTVPHLIERLGTLSTSRAGSGWRAPASHIFVGRQRAYLQDFDVEVANGASVADPTIGTLNEGSVLDVRVLGVSGVGAGSERRALRKALERLTGRSSGLSADAWRRWWESDGARWLEEESSTPER